MTKSWLLAVSLSLGACSGSCGRSGPSPKPPAAAPAPAPPAASAKLTPIRIGYVNTDGEVISGEICEVLRRTDILERNGLKAEFLVSDLARPVDLSDVDVAFIVPGRMYSVVYAERPIALVAPLWLAGVNAIVVPQSSNLRSMQDLKGKRLESVMTPVLLRTVLSGHSMSPKDLVLTESSRNPDLLLQDLQKGQIDAAAVWTPWLEYYEDRQLVRVLDGNVFGSLVVMDKDYAQRPDDAGVRFAVSLLEAAAFLTTIPDQAHRWYAQSSGIDYKFVQQIERSSQIYKRGKTTSAPEDFLSEWQENASYLQGALISSFAYGEFYQRVRKVAPPGKELDLALAHHYVPDLDGFLAPDLLGKARQKLRSRDRAQVRILQPDGEPGAEQVRGWLKSAAEDERLKGLEEITQHRRQGFQADAIALLADASPEVRAAAARAVGRLKLGGAEEGLQRLLADPSAVVVESAIDAAARVDPARFKPTLLALLGHAAPAVREAAVDAVAASYASDEAALEKIVPLLEDADPRVRLESAWCLVEAVKDADRGAALAGHIYKSKPPMVLEQRLPVMFAGKFAASVAKMPWLAWAAQDELTTVSLRMIAELPPPTALAVFEQMSKSKSSEHRVGGLWGLGRLERRAPGSATAALEAALQAAFKDPDANLRRAAFELAGHWKLASAAPQVGKALKDASADVRVAACYAASELGLADTAVRMIELLADRDPLVRETAARGLGKLKVKSAAAALKARSADPESGVVKMSQWALSQLEGH